MVAPKRSDNEARRQGQASTACIFYHVMTAEALPSPLQKTKASR
jgi:hypothetical protein